jgi:type IV secretion system protein TrbE
MWNLREHRKSPDRLSDVLPWAALATPGVVLNKDGSFQSTIAYRGPDLESATREELLVNSSHINNIIRRLGSNWAVFFEAQRISSDSYSASQWPDPISDLIDQERLSRFKDDAHFESNYYLSLVYLPPQERTTRVVRSLFDAGVSDRIDYETFLEYFVAEANKVVDLLGRIFPEVRFLTEGELLGYLHSTVSTKHHPIALPEVPVYLDAILADTPLLGGFKPMLGDETLAVISIMGYPPMTYPCVLDTINNLSIEYRWVTRYIALDRVQTQVVRQTQEHPDPHKGAAYQGRVGSL